MSAASLYPNSLGSPVVWCIGALLVLTSGCATTAPQPDEQPTSTGFEDPESAVEAFAEAWNAESLDEVTQTFAHDRRHLVGNHLDERPQRMRGYRVVDAKVSMQCHPRGAYWKTATLQLGPREQTLPSAAPEQEIVWLRLQDGYWFMYSL